MNEKHRQVIRNNTARKVEQASKIHRNCIRVNSNNTIEHEQLKFEICYWLKKNGKEFITEAKFSDGSGIADILVLDDDIVIEVLHSETEERFKTKNYPVSDIIKIKTGEDFRRKLT